MHVTLWFLSTSCDYHMYIRTCTRSHVPLIGCYNSCHMYIRTLVYIAYVRICLCMYIRTLVYIAYVRICLCMYIRTYVQYNLPG